MKNSNKAFYNIFLVILISVIIFPCDNSFAQDNKPYVRIVKLTVDSLQLDNFRAALKEHAAVAIKTDPGVLTFYAVYDKDQPTNVTLFEIYASVAAYEAHSKTTDHLKYISAIKDMVQLPVFTDVIPIALETKPKR